MADDLAALAAFAEARLAEDEAAAKAAASVAGPDWEATRMVTTDGGTMAVADPDGTPVADTLSRDDEEIAPFVARHDPARVLREVAAARKLLAEHLPIESIYGTVCKRCVSWVDAPLAEGGETEFGIAIPDPWPCLPVRAAAAKWADHPGYRKEWAP